MKKMKKRSSKDVEVHTTVEIGDVEREVTMTFHCSVGEEASRHGPAFPPEAELQSVTFDDTGEVADEYVNPADFEAEALEKADEEDEAAYERYCDMKMRQRWEA